MVAISPIFFALLYFCGETVILLLERHGRSFFIALAVLNIALPFMMSDLKALSGIVGRTILTWSVAGRIKIKDSEAYPLA
jgi:uncharacterized membrane protein